MKKRVAVIIFTAIAIVLALITILYGETLRAIWIALKSPSEDIVEILEDSSSTPIKLSNGFSISIFAPDVPGARVIIFDEFGDMWVSQTKEGKILRLTIKNGRETSRETMFQGLNKPHGIAFDPQNPALLYIAEENKLSKINLNSRDKELETILNFPSGDGHFTRTLGFGPDNRLYISVGSSCNVCGEDDSMRATILSIGRGAGDFETFATGLRNSVFFTWNTKTQKMWATEMGRDLLGDDLPPDEINIVERGKFYGWPRCYGKNIHDIEYDKNTYFRNPCQKPFEIPAYIDIPAHSAPLGLAFIPPTVGWPQEYWHNLIVAYHGSWNSTTPTGYKLVRIKLDERGEFVNKESPQATSTSLGTGASAPSKLLGINSSPQVEDFVSGWLTEKQSVLGRPVDVVFGPEGALYVSDDKAGVIYKITYKTK